MCAAHTFCTWNGMEWRTYLPLLARSVCFVSTITFAQLFVSVPFRFRASHRRCWLRISRFVGDSALWLFGRSVTIHLCHFGWCDPQRTCIYSLAYGTHDSTTEMAHSSICSHDAYLSFVLNPLLVDIIYFIILFFNSFSTSTASRHISRTNSLTIAQQKKKKSIFCVH